MPPPEDPSPDTPISPTAELSPVEVITVGPRPEWPDWIPSTKPHLPGMCHAKRSFDGLPCRKPAVRAGVCLKHGAAAPQVKAAALRRYEQEVPATIDRIVALRDQSDHLPTAMNASAHIIDRAIGPMKGAGGPAAAIQINIGGAWSGEVLPPEDSEDRD